MVTAPGPAGLSDDERLTFVLFGVEDLMGDPAPVEELRDKLRGLDGGRADQDGPALGVEFGDFVDGVGKLDGLIGIDDIRIVDALKVELVTCG
jgi:hypothetical protein